jgi:uncharacterized protein
MKPLVPQLAAWQWAIGAACAFLIGVAKTGAPGVGLMTVPLMVFAVGDSRLSAAWTAPILIVGDVFAVWYWHRHAEAAALLSLIPSVVVGMFLGGVALSADDVVLRRVLGVIVLSMLALTVARRRHPASVPGGHPAMYGVVAGFATTVANAAGPVMSSYLLLQRMPKERLVATGAWFFLTVNVAKLPIYAVRGLFSWRSLTFDLLLAPLVVCGAFVGLVFLKRLSQRVFDAVTLTLSGVATLLLFR